MWQSGIRTYVRIWYEDFLQPTNVWFSDHVRQRTLNMLIVNTMYIYTLKIIPRTYLEILKQHTQQRHFVCNFSLPSIVETRSFYCLSKKILLHHLDKNSCEHVNRTKIFDHRVLACLQFRTYIFCLVVIYIIHIWVYDVIIVRTDFKLNGVFDRIWNIWFFICACDATWPPTSTCLNTNEESK